MKAAESSGSLANTPPALRHRAAPPGWLLMWPWLMPMTLNLIFGGAWLPAAWRTAGRRRRGEDRRTRQGRGRIPADPHVAVHGGSLQRNQASTSPLLVAQRGNLGASVSISQCARGPTPARSRSATPRLARAAGAADSATAHNPLPGGTLPASTRSRSATSRLARAAGAAESTTALNQQPGGTTLRHKSRPTRFCN